MLVACNRFESELSECQYAMLNHSATAAATGVYGIENFQLSHLSGAETLNDDFAC